MSGFVARQSLVFDRKIHLKIHPKIGSDFPSENPVFHTPKKGFVGGKNIWS